jgi:hypothetical protein
MLLSKLLFLIMPVRTSVFIRTLYAKFWWSNVMPLHDDATKQPLSIVEHLFHGQFTHSSFVS